MKFPSLFTKVPTYQRFNYKPRYYDPDKEEKELREERIRRELDTEQGTQGPDAGDYRSRIKGSFQAARRRSKPSSDSSVVLIRLAVLLFIALFIIAFLTWGKPAVYSLFIFFPVYIYFKFFRK